MRALNIEVKLETSHLNRQLVISLVSDMYTIGSLNYQNFSYPNISAIRAPIIIIMIFINVTCYSEKKDQSEIAQPMVGLQVTGYTFPGPCREGVCITKPLWNKN